MITTRLVLVVALVSLLAASTAWIDSRQPEYVTPSEPPQRARIIATGVVEGLTQDIQMRPEIDGAVANVAVRPNDWVEAGDLLIQLDDRRQRQQLVASKAQVRLAEAQRLRLENGASQQQRNRARALVAAKQARYEQARKASNRIERLLQQAAISQQEYDDHLAALETAEAEVDAARAALAELEAPTRADELEVAAARVAASEAEYELARVALEKTRLVAPCRALVLDVNVEPGELVSSTMTTPAIVLSDAARLRVRAYVEEIEAPSLRVGIPAEVSADGLPGKRFPGRIVSLMPRMQTKTLATGRADELYDTKVREVLIELDNAEELLIGLRVDVEFTLTGGEPSRGSGDTNG